MQTHCRQQCLLLHQSSTSCCRWGCVDRVSNRILVFRCCTLRGACRQPGWCLVTVPRSAPHSHLAVPTCCACTGLLPVAGGPAGQATGAGNATLILHCTARWAACDAQYGQVQSVWSAAEQDVRASASLQPPLRLTVPSPAFRLGGLQKDTSYDVPRIQGYLAHAHEVEHRRSPLCLK